MPSILFPLVMTVPGAVPPALRRVTCSVTREGDVTPSTKVVRLFKDPSNPVPVAVFFLKGGAPVTQPFLASAFTGDWVAIAIDDTPPRLGAVKFINVNQDLTLSFDLTEGDTSNPGQPGTVAAVVKVDGQPAARRVVAVELATDGFWRLVGEGATDTAGAGRLDVKVTPSAQVFVMAVDAWGVPYQANLAVAVGDVIRPSVFRGWVYRITQAGNLPATEPTWWDEGTTGPQPLGTARAEVARYFRPLAHGPVAVEVT